MIIIILIMIMLIIFIDNKNNLPPTVPLMIVFSDGWSCVPADFRWVALSRSTRPPPWMP